MEEAGQLEIASEPQHRCCFLDGANDYSANVFKVHQIQKQDMDDLLVTHPKSILSPNTLDLYLKLLLLLQNVIHNQSLMQHCDLKTDVGRFPNFTSKAGSAFIFRLPVPASQGHVQHYQVS